MVRAFNRTLDFVAHLIPIPGLQSIVGIVNAIVRAATTYIDETIFSYNLARGDENAWRSSKDALIYYCQNSKEILKTAVWVVVLDKALTAVVWVVMLLPAFLLLAILPGVGTPGGFIAGLVVAALFASNVRQAFLKPIFLVMVMTKFHVLVRNQAINLRVGPAAHGRQQEVRRDQGQGRRLGADAAARSGCVAAERVVIDA